jgi:hypothetical protein
MPNKSVKATRRPLAVLKFWFLSRFGGFVWLSLAAYPLLASFFKLKLLEEDFI